MGTEPSLQAVATGGTRAVVWMGLLALLVLAVSLITVPEYGITSDESIFYHSAERQIWALQSSQPDRWDFRKDPPAAFAKTVFFSTHPDERGVFVANFPGLFAVITGRAAQWWLGFGPLDAAHAGLELLHALILFGMGLYLARLLGLRRALIAMALYAAFPTVVGHSHYNVRDLPMAGFYALTLLAAACGVIENRARFVVQAAVWFGLAVSSKATAAFALPTLALWVPVAMWLLYWRQRWPSRRVLASVVLFPFLACATFWAAWPYLQHGTMVEQWRKVVEFFSLALINAGMSRPGLTDYSLVVLGTMTPPIVLAGLLIAAPAPWMGDARQRAIGWLLWIWFAIPLVRIALPGANFYDGNRLFIEYVAPLVILAAAGIDLAAHASQRMVARLYPRAAGLAVPAVIGVSLLCAVVPLASYHPYEAAYFNVFAGGLGGAQASRLLTARCPSFAWGCFDGEGDYWGSSFRNAARVLGRVAEPGAQVWACGNLIAPLSYAQGFRPDIGVPRRRDESDYAIVVPRRPFCSDFDQQWIREHTRVVYEERRDGGLVFGVYRIDRRGKGVPGQPTSQPPAPRR